MADNKEKSVNLEAMKALVEELRDRVVRLEGEQTVKGAKTFEDLTVKTAEDFVTIKFIKDGNSIPAYIGYSFPSKGRGLYFSYNEVKRRLVTEEMLSEINSALKGHGDRISANEDFLKPFKILGEDGKLYAFKNGEPEDITVAIAYALEISQSGILKNLEKSIGNVSTNLTDETNLLKNRLDVVEGFLAQFTKMEDNRTYAIMNGKPELIAEVGEAVVTVDTSNTATLEMQPGDMPIISVTGALNQFAEGEEMVDDVELEKDNEDEKED